MNSMLKEKFHMGQAFNLLIAGFRLLAVLFFVLSLINPSSSFGQSVVVTAEENNVPIKQVKLLVEEQEIIQESPNGNENPEPFDVPVIIKSIELENGKSIFATTRKPTVTNPNSILGTEGIPAHAVEIIKYDQSPFVSHRSPEFFESLQGVVSTPDLRSYWSIGGQPSIPDGDHFVDLMYADQVITSGYLLFTERFGNSPIDFIALDRNGNQIEGTNVVKIRGWQWDTGVNHVVDVPHQTQWMVLFSPMIFDSPEPIHGIRIISVDEPDGKLVFFVNAIFAAPDFAEGVNSETGGKAVVNIFENDELNGFPLNPMDIELSVLEPFPENTIVLNEDGSVDVPPGTPEGVYTLTYQINVSDTEYDSAVVTVEVMEYKPEAFDDFATLDNSLGKENILNVLENDLLNGLPAKIEDVVLTETGNTSDGALILNPNGTVDVITGTSGGVYQLTYQICDRQTPDKCDVAEVTIIIEDTKEVDLSINKTSFGIEIYEGNEFEYEISLENSGITDAEGVVIEDLLPEGITYLGFSSPDFDGEVTVAGNKISWTIPSVPAGSHFTFKIKVRADGKGPITNIVTLSVEEGQQLKSGETQATDTNQVREFFIPNVITPGTIDGKNDHFEIRGIENFAKTSLTIFNRNGDHVFEAENYNNKWAAEGLSGGSYYYVLVIEDREGREQKFKGWIQVIK